MSQLKKIFRIRRDERWMALAVLLVLTALNGMVIAKYYDLFSVYTDSDWGPFPRHFHVSGFDTTLYTIVSKWGSFMFVAYRHPLLVFMLYPLYLLNQLLYWLTGSNCVQFVTGVTFVFTGVYAFLYQRRILRYVLRLRQTDAWLLAIFTFSFAFILLSLVVPDHFGYSLFLLTYVLFVTGMHLRLRRPMSLSTEISLFLFTGGVTLSNGVKVFLAAWFANGRRFFRWKYLLFGVLLPAGLLWLVGELQYKYIVRPGEIARTEARVQRLKALGKSAVKHQARRSRKDGRPMGKGRFLSWTDTTTPRWDSAVENLFGESVQFHEGYLLKDVHMHRPVIVRYPSVWNYVVEFFIVFLFLTGIWFGRSHRFLWLMLSWFAFDLFLHFGLGFGLNEVYIMATHWLFVVPLAMGYIPRMASRRGVVLFRTAVVLLTVFLLLHNVKLMISYFT